ncbi:condensin complex subunit 3 [Brachionus plicatilis]|uniref:Condensin complex subunit 3 n=1 Tax=Brachionus plicatilis TaxID=10195 RepID=A0A3M7Q154_BRAPC|nr:condensin complex subunit 3 [Brachionus plicatilis]
MSSTREKIIKIFDQSQEPYFDIDEGVHKLRDLLAQGTLGDKDLFLSDYTNSIIRCMQIVLVSHEVFRCNLVIEFLVQVLIQFDKSEIEYQVKNEIIFYLFSIIRSNSDTVRLRLYEILKKYLDSIKLTLSGEIDEKIFSKIQLLSLDAIRDCNLNAQLKAIQVASHFQVPHDSDCKIINGFINLLRHDASTQIRLLILDLIVLNDLTFNFIKNRLIYDSVEQIRNKALQLIENKVPREFFQPLFRKQIIDCLLRNQNGELLRKFIRKWLFCSDQKNLVEKVYLFICDLDLEGTWFINTDYFYVTYLEDKLFKTMDLVFEEIFAKEKIEIFAQEILDTGKNLIKDINILFLVRSFVKFSKIETMSDIGQKLFAKLKNRDIKILPLYQLITILIDLKMNKVNILTEIDDLTSFYDKKYELVYEVLLRQVDNKIRLNFLWKIYDDLIVHTVDKDQRKKFLTIIYIVLDTMTDKDFENSTMLDLNLSLNDQLNIDVDLNQNIIEYFIEKIVITNISDLDPKVRALAARALGHASLLDYEIAINYLQIFYQMINLDYSEPVCEATNSLVNILLHHAEKLSLNYDLFIKIFDRLENQIDCEDSKCTYLTCAGFCKLLLNNVEVPSRSLLLSKLVLAYFRCDRETNSDLMVKKLKACLGEFFTLFKNDDIHNEIYRSRNSVLLSKTIKIVLKYLIKKNLPINDLKHVAKFYYYITSDCKNGRLIIINLILDEILKASSNYYLTQKLIEVLLEFSVNDSDVDEISQKYLNLVYEQLENLISKFKREKWIMNREYEIRCLISSIKSFRNRAGSGTKRKLDQDK